MLRILHFLRVKLNYVAHIGEGENSNPIFWGVVLQATFSPGNSPEDIQPGYWNRVFFYSAQNNADYKFVYFALLAQLWFFCIFYMIHVWSISLLIFCFYHLLIKFILFPHWKFNASSYLWLRYYFVFSLFTALIGACFSKKVPQNLMKYFNVDGVTVTS